MKLQDTQFTPEELAIMRGEDMPEAKNEPQQASADADDGDEPPEGDDQAEQTEQKAQAKDEPAADADEAPASPEPFIPQFDATGPENYDEAKKAIRQERSEARQKWSMGELSDEQFAQVEATLEDRLEALQSEHLTAQALAKANAQIQAQQQRQTLEAIATKAKADGIDYADEGVAILYDTKLRQVLADAAFQGKPFSEQAAEAHARVAKLFGKATTPAAGTQADGAKPSERSKVPPTLAQLPAAAAPNMGHDPAADDLGDDPELAEARWAQMPTAKRNAVLRASLPARR